MKKLTLLISALFIGLFVNAQDEETQHARVTSFSVRPGVFAVLAPATADDYNLMKGLSSAPEDLFIDATDYNLNPYGNFSGGGALRFDLGITPYSKKKNKLLSNRELRISIGSDRGMRRNFNFTKKTILASDTLFDSDGNPVVKRNKESYEKHGYSEKFITFSAGVSYVFKSNPDRRLHFYAGVGLEYAISLRATLNISQRQDTIYYSTSMEENQDNNRYPFNNYYYGNYYGQDNVSQIYKINGASHFFRGYLPLGIDFRFSNKNSFFKHLHIFSELAPGLEIQITGGQTMANPYFGVVFAGLQYRW